MHTLATIHYTQPGPHSTRSYGRIWYEEKLRTLIPIKPLARLNTRYQPWARLGADVDHRIRGGGARGSYNGQTLLHTRLKGWDVHMSDSRRRPGDEDEDEDTELLKEDDGDDEVVRLRAGMGIALLDVAGEDILTASWVLNRICLSRGGCICTPSSASK
jgi:hypothetical protein